MTLTLSAVPRLMASALTVAVRMAPGRRGSAGCAGTEGVPDHIGC